MWTSYFQYFLRFLLIGAFLRVAFELDRPRSTATNTSSGTRTESLFSDLSPLRREWAEKSVAGYIRQQEKKWHRWDEALFKAKYSPDS